MHILSPRYLDRDVCRIRKGRPALMLTCLPREAGKQSKEVLDLDRDSRDIPEEVREAVKKGIPAMAETAERVICQAFEDSFDMLEISEYDYIVVITRGHRHDTLCLRELFSRTETYYLGMIGSKHRVGGVKQLMVEEGYDAERIGRICTPIGLKIGAVTPEEIAVSILAELISRKRLGNGRGRASFDRSELDPEVLPAILDQKDRSFAVVTVMSVKGSAPRGPGAKMLVYPDLRIVGSIGGGCSEARSSGMRFR